MSLLFSPRVMSDSSRPYGLQHTRLPCPSPSPGVCPRSCPLNQWCHPTISSSVTLFSFCCQSLSASGSFPLSQLFASSSHSIGVSSFSTSPSKEYSGLISFKIDRFDLLAFQGTLKSLLQHCNSKHQFFSTLPSLLSSSHIGTWLLERP